MNTKNYRLNEATTDEAKTANVRSRAVRKGTKRAARKKLKALGRTLTPGDRRTLRKEPQGVKTFLAGKAKAKADAEAAE